jgi:hypothetical protein
MVLTTVVMLAGGLVIVRGGQTPKWWNRRGWTLTRRECSEQFCGDQGDGRDRFVE